MLDWRSKDEVDAKFDTHYDNIIKILAMSSAV